MYESTDGNNIPKIEVPAIVTPDAIPDDAQAVAEILAAARKQMEEFRALMAPIKEQQKGFLKESEAFMKQAREAERKAKQAENAMFDAQRAVRKIEQTVEIADRKLNRIKALEKFQREARLLESEFEFLTASAPWREFALEHQIRGMHHLARAKRCLLADAPRFGKTMTVLGTLDMLQAKKVLILTPNTVTNEFVKQVKRWAPHRAAVVNLAGKSKLQRNSDLKVLAYLKEFIVVCNYEAWRKDFALLDAFVEAKFDTVIIDEAHNINNSKTSVFKGIEKVVFAENMRDEARSCEFCNEPVRLLPSVTGFGTSWQDEYGSRDCILNENYPNTHSASPCSVENVFPMTVTVIVNKPQDLWALLNLIDRRNFPDRYAFERDYLMKDYDTGKWVFRPGGLDRLTKRLADKYIRRDRQNSPEIDIPTPEIVVRELTLDPIEYPAQYKVIRDLNRAIVDYAEDKRIGIDYAITLILRKRQAITWPHFDLKDNDGETMLSFQVDESIKIDECIKFQNSDRNEWVGMIPELIESGEKVVLASQFVGTLSEIERRARLAGISVTNLGTIPVNERVQAADNFNNSQQPGLMLGHYKVMGTGINLAGADEIIILDEAWNPATNDQMYDRIVEMGKETKCQVTILRVNSSIDTWMAGINDQKRNMIEGFTEHMDMAASLINEIRGGLL